MELTEILLISLVVLLMGVSKSAFAGALGVFAVPLLMFKFTALEAITLMLPLLIIADIMSVKSFWRKWDTHLLRRLIPGAFIGVALASALMNHISPPFLRTIIAAICIIFALKQIAFKDLHLAILDNRAGAYLMSGCSGVTSTLVHAGGPPIIIYFSAIGLAKTQFVATAAAFFAMMNVFKLAGVLSLGLLTTEAVVTAIGFFPVALVGNWLGLKIHAFLDKQSFMHVMHYLLLLLGMWLLLSGN